MLHMALAKNNKESLHQSNDKFETAAGEEPPATNEAAISSDAV